GSTGKPKGAGNRHSALVNRLCWMQQAYQLTAEDSVLQKTPFSFDVSVWEFFWPLMTGSSLVVAAPGAHRDPAQLIQVITEQRITTLHFVPSMLQAFLQDPAVAECTSLTRIVCSGEALQVDAQQQVFAKLPNAGLFNLYGPTEAAIDVTHWTCRDEGRDSVPIGQPIANLSTYILDNSLAPLPVGVIGELYLGGEGLARGYHRRPALTAERFVTSPFGDGQRLYRTGDLARYRADGVIEYAGRMDHQVKIRGLRIELGEIEARLAEHDDVRETVVIAQDGSLLVAYVVPDDEALLNADDATRSAKNLELKAHLGQSLPEFMVPQHWVWLEKMPVSPNGKLERKALPKFDASTLQNTFVAPQSELQKHVAAIWQDVLKLERVGLTDNFFELGGHSLLVTQVVSRIRRTLDIQVPLRTLFEHSSLEAFVRVLDADQQTTQTPIPQVGREQPLALSYAQERQWFLWQMDPQSAAYNIPTALRLRGELDRAALEQSFQALIQRHESLRTAFVDTDGRVQQVIRPSGQVALHEQTLANATEEQIKTFVEQQTQQAFDLLAGELLRVTLLRISDTDHVLVLTLHHIVSDGWSMQVMIEDLIACYAAFSQGRAAELPALAVQYADYAVWQREWMDNGERERQLTYWKTQLGSEQPLLEMPADHPRPAVQSFRGARLNVTLEPALGDALKALARREGVTVFMLLLASFQTLLHRYSGQSDIRVGVPIANRNRLEIERLIGFFVNTQVLRAEFDPALDFARLLQQVKHTAIAAQMHQDLPFEQLVDALQPERNLSHSPLFQAMFNHRTEAESDLVAQLPGLNLQSLSWEHRTAQFDLALDTGDSPEGLDASFTYATDLFEASSIQRLAGHWLNLLKAVVADPARPLAELVLLDGAERELIVEGWNATATEYPLSRSVHSLIEEQVRATPDALALVFGEQRLTYAQLNARANQLAAVLIENGVGPEV
ncbi:MULTISPECIES: non-ribosomal peptide synthetase, partial [unclassified Pseudomonas]